MSDAPFHTFGNHDLLTLHKEKRPPEIKAALDANRLMIITRYAYSVTHASEETCHQRNRLMMELANEIVIGFASPGLQ